MASKNGISSYLRLDAIIPALIFASFISYIILTFTNAKVATLIFFAATFCGTFLFGREFLDFRRVDDAEANDPVKDETELN